MLYVVMGAAQRLPCHSGRAKILQLPLGDARFLFGLRTV